MEVHSPLQTFVLGAVTATEVALPVFLTNKIYKYLYEQDEVCPCGI